jgi:hypothetical protein
MASAEVTFYTPRGNAAIMQVGPKRAASFTRKEPCLALSKQLQSSSKF